MKFKFIADLTFDSESQEDATWELAMLILKGIDDVHAKNLVADICGDEWFLPFKGSLGLYTADSPHVPEGVTIH